MRTHSRRIWPPFVAVALLALLGVFVLDGVAAGVVSLLDLSGLLGAAIYALAGEEVQDGCGGIGGGVIFRASLATAPAALHGLRLPFRAEPPPIRARRDRA
jgi:hypothetical protein